MIIFQLVVLPIVLARPEAQHGYGPKCRTVYKTQYKGGIIFLSSILRSGLNQYIYENSEDMSMMSWYRRSMRPPTSRTVL